jgi:hypothetical protein
MAKKAGKIKGTFTLRVKSKHNPPSFGLGKGVLAVQEISYDQKDLDKPLGKLSFAAKIQELSNQLRDDFIEVIYKEKKNAKTTRKRK